MHQVGDQPRLYYDARSTSHQGVFVRLQVRVFVYMCVRMGIIRVPIYTHMYVYRYVCLHTYELM